MRDDPPTMLRVPKARQSALDPRPVDHGPVHLLPLERAVHEMPLSRQIETRSVVTPPRRSRHILDGDLDGPVRVRVVPPRVLGHERVRNLPVLARGWQPAHGQGVEGAAEGRGFGGGVAAVVDCRGGGWVDGSWGEVVICRCYEDEGHRC